VLSNLNAHTLTGERAGKIMSTEPLVVFITPEVKTALEAEVERAGVGGGLAGGLLFGHPLDERRRLVIGWARPRTEVRFGEKDFNLDQSRTSQQLANAQKLSPEAHYCGVWYIHRTPNKELTDEEWRQTQSVLEDPDYRFGDLVCLVICLYFGELTIYASTFDKYQSARGQFPTPASLLEATDSESLPTDQTRRTRPSTAQRTRTDWYKSPDVAERLNEEHERLTQKYDVEAKLTPDEQMIFRLMPKSGHGKLTFYLVCGPGFPESGPTAFLATGEKRYPLFSPGMHNWSAGEHWLVHIADDMVEWLTWSLDEYMTTAEQALKRGDYQEAADWLTVVLSIDPRRPRAARLLARAQAPLH
jgi:hypothetical protein